jgi:hypothetical protein
MRRLSLFLVAALALMLIGPAPVSANNDPHRSFMPTAPFDLAAGTYCAFPVHVDVLADREYATISTLPDGSTLYTVRGSLMLGVTNENTSKTMTVNSGGPGTYTYPPDSVNVIGDFLGQSALWAPNLTGNGFPSNFVATAGPVSFTMDMTTGDFSNVSAHPHVLTDICTALAP